MSETGLSISYVEKEVELPSGFHDTTSGEVYKTVVIREMSGVEEDLLLNENVAKSGNTLNKILSNVCKLKEKPNLRFVDNLLMVDQLYLLVQVRILTYGNNYRFEVKHDRDQGGCGGFTHVSLELDSLEFTPPAKPELEQEVFLPKSKVTVVFKKNQGKDQANLTKILTSKAEDKISQLLQYRTRKVLTEGGDDLGIEAIKRLPLSDRKLLREEMNEAEGKAETSIEVECASCGEEMKVALPLDQNFFCLKGPES